MRICVLAKCLSALVLCLAAAVSAQTAAAQPTLATEFSPDEIGAGGTSTLTYTITNGSGSPVTDLAFTNTFPAAITIQTPASAATTCTGGTLTAPAGGGTVTLSDGTVAGGGSCTVTVQVTATTIGDHTNPSVTLSSSAGSSASLAHDLTVSASAPGFTKTLSPASVGLSDTSTVTYTFDNTASATAVTYLSFSETLPAGLVIESPANVTNTCGGFSSTISAPAGGDTFSAAVQGLNTPAYYVVPAGASCTVSFDIKTSASGTYDLTSSSLTYGISGSGSQMQAGASTAALTVTTPPAGVVGLIKDFTSNTVAPGGTVELAFTLTNPSSSSDATGVTFTDDLDAMLSGAVVTGALPSNPCGVGSALSGSSLLTLTGGTIGARDACSFTVTVQVPGGAAAGDYVNTTSTVSATIDGAATSGPADSDTLTVLSGQPGTLAKAFSPDTLAAGDTGQLVYTLANPNGSLALGDLAFSDNVNDFGANVTVTGIATTCGGSAALTSATEFQLVSGALAASATCTVTLDFSLSASTPNGTYGGTSSALTGTFPDTSSFAGNAASGTVLVGPGGDLAGLTLTKTFNAVSAGEGTTVAMSLVLNNSSETVSATQLSFTDDLDAFYSGTTLGSVLTNTCGGSVGGSSTLSYTGGTVAPDSTCEIEVELSLGTSGTGSFLNTTSNLTAAADSGAASELTGTTASDSLTITTYSALDLTKEFIDDPAVPGGTVTLRFSLTNPNSDAGAAASSIVFSDNLSNTMSGLAATGLPASVCGGTVSGTTSLLFSGGSLAPGASCSFDVTLSVPGGATSGTYGNTTSGIAATIDGAAYTGAAASDQLVVEADPLSILSDFTDSPVVAGDTATLVYSFENTSSAQGITGAAFTDAISTAIPGASFSVAGNSCGGTVSGSGTASFSGIDLAASATCTVTLEVTVPGGTATGDYSTTPATASYDFGGASLTATPGGATLTVTDFVAPTFTKAFSVEAEAAGAAVDVTFSITNNDASPLSGLAFSDDLSAFLSGTVATSLPSTPCGAGSAISGTSLLTLTGGTLAASGTCSFTVSLLLPAGATPGSYGNTTSDLTSNGLTIASGASDSLEILPPPSFAKAFALATVDLGETTTMTLTIDNAASGYAATALDVTDNLPAGMVVATPPNASTTCTGGTLTAVAGAGTLSYSGGTVAGAAACTVSVDVTGTTAGALTNTTGDLTSSLGNSGAASATLTVNAAIAPTLTKAFAVSGADEGETVNMTLTVANPNAFVAVGSISLTDTFPAGLEAAGAPSGDAFCVGGSFAGGDGDLAISWTGGSIDAGETCTVTVAVRVTGTADVTNTAELTSDANATPVDASDTLLVNAGALPTLAKSFSETGVTQGEALTMTVEIGNPNAFVDIADLDMTDAFPAGLEISTDAVGDATCSTGALTGAAGDTALSWTGGVLAAGETCTITVGVTVTGDSSLSNTAELVSERNATAIPATAALAVSPAGAPLLTKSFSQGTATQGETLTMTLAVENANDFATVTDIDLTDAFPAGLEIATAASGDATCASGTLAGDAGDTQLDWTDGVLAPGETCTITADVTVTGGSDLTNTAEMTSSANAAPVSANASLTVTGGSGPDLTKAFSETTAEVGQEVTMTLTLSNPNNFLDLTGIDLTDTFPAGLEITTGAAGDAGCTGGTLTGVAGGTSVDWSGGSIGIGETCTITAGVTGTATGSVTNSAEVTSIYNAAATQALATITFVDKLPPELTKTFSASAAVQGETLTLTLAVTNPNSFSELDGVALSDTFPAGLVLATDATADAGCTGGTLTGAAGETAIGWTGGTLATGATCTVTAEVTVTGTTDLTNTASVTTTTFPTALDASAALTVTAAPPPGFAMAFSPAIIPQGSTTRVTFTLDNSGALIDADTAAFAATFDSALVLAADPAVSNSCTGGTVTAAAGTSSLSLSGATIPAGDSCEIGVTVTGTTVGTFAETAGPLTTSLGASGSASATLEVEAVTGGTVTFIQRADPDGTFSFTSAEALLNFSIVTSGGNGSYGPVTLAPGSYTVVQSRPAGFGNSAISCSDADSSATAQSGEIVLDVAAGEAITCTLTSVQTDTKTVETINRFLFRRADLLLASEPDMARRIDRLTRGFGNASALRFATGDVMSFSPFNFDPMSLRSDTINVSGSLLTMRQAGASLKLAHGATSDTAFVSNYRWDAWFEAQFKKFDDSEGEGRFGVVYFGADYLVTDSVLVGLMTSIDMITEESPANDTTVSGGGWMMGPYMTARLAPNLYFDARVAAGTSTNKISPFNTYTDSFRTSRWMAQMSLTGDYRKGPWTIRPNASLSYFQETQDGYVDGLGVTIPSQTIALGQARFGPTIAGNFVTDGGLSYRPYFTLEAIYNMGTTMGVTLADDSPNSDGWRGRFQTGVSFAMPEGASLSLGASYDGLFRDDYETLGFSFKFEIPLAITKAE
ncbi:hypothetical protein [Psychromarinibacter sp. S121]|uniref:DUF7933 domain-containing protein n=1 Tax=Psychromarinibacter sp. S121 TaxID=3415127 RepID=UPI003C7E482C